MPDPDVTKGVREFVVSTFLFDDWSSLPGDHESLLANGIVDSTGVLELLMFAEETFAISVPDEDVTPANFDSIAHLAAYIEERLAEARLAS